LTEPQQITVPDHSSKKVVYSAYPQVIPALDCRLEFLLECSACINDSIRHWLHLMIILTACCFKNIERTLTQEEIHMRYPFAKNTHRSWSFGIRTLCLLVLLGASHAHAGLIYTVSHSGTNTYPFDLSGTIEVSHLGEFASASEFAANVIDYTITATTQSDANTWTYTWTPDDSSWGLGGKGGNVSFSVLEGSIQITSPQTPFDFTTGAPATPNHSNPSVLFLLSTVKVAVYPCEPEFIQFCGIEPNLRFVDDELYYSYALRSLAIEYVARDFTLATASDPDSDGDGIDDSIDNCSEIPNADQANFDEDSYGDTCDEDVDNDGVDYSRPDSCPFTALGTVVNQEGCNAAQFVAHSCVADNFKNHGQYVSCVSHAANEAVDQGLIYAHEKSVFIKQAAKSK
jgi:hypothetical protein